jgi:lysophospholipase L1-like esterase
LKHILCFGDSNTHGYIPGGGRYDEQTRWTGLLAELLGSEYRIIEEGQNGRTSSFDDPFDPYKNASDYIIPCLETHEPLDLTVLMLGSNDMKQYLNPSVEKIADSLHHLAQTILTYSGAPVLLVSPILLGENMEQSIFSSSFSAAGVAISHQLGNALKQVADDLKIPFLDAASVATPSAADSLHLDEDGHRKLAHALAEKIKEIL